MPRVGSGARATSSDEGDTDVSGAVSIECFTTFMEHGTNVGEVGARVDLGATIVGTGKCSGHAEIGIAGIRVLGEAVGA